MMKTKSKHSKRWVQRQVKHYLNLPYTTTLRKEEDEEEVYYVATVDELPGCSTHGTSALEALGNLFEVQQAWLSVSIEQGLPIPLPNDPSKLPSGKWIQRVPRSLHLKLTLLAKKEGVSLNQLVTSILGEAVGVRSKDKHRQPWNWCHKCQQLVDVDDIQDGSEVYCLGCRRFFFCVKLKKGGWKLDPITRILGEAVRKT